MQLWISFRNNTTLSRYGTIHFQQHGKTGLTVQFVVYKKAFSLYFSSRSYLISWPPCPKNPLSLTSTEWSHGCLTLIAILLEQKLVLVLTVLSSQVVTFERWSHQFSLKWWLLYGNWQLFFSLSPHFEWKRYDVWVKKVVSSSR